MLDQEVRRPAYGSTSGVDLLADAVAVLLAEDPTAWDAAPALARGARLLRLREQLEVSVLASIADLEAREAFVHDACGSTRDWLRTQPCGDGGLLNRAHRWAARARVQAAVAAGAVGRTSADQVCAALSRIAELSAPGRGWSAPTAPMGSDQILGVLVGAVPDALRQWVGQGLSPEQLASLPDGQVMQLMERRERLADVLTGCADDELAGPADRLEPALVLLAEGLSPSNLTAALAQIVDALQPEALDAGADRQQADTSWRLTHRPDGGWDLRAVLDDETGALLDAEIRRRMKAAGKLAAQHAAQDAERALVDALVDLPSPSAAGDPELADLELADPEPVELAQADLERADLPLADLELADLELAEDPDLDAADAEGTAAGSAQTDADRFGRAGPGVPPLLQRRSTRGEPLASQPVEGSPVRSLAQAGVDALRMLLQDLDGVPEGSGAPRPVQLTVLGSQNAFDGIPGATPVTMDTALGSIRLAPEVARRLACDSLLSRIRLDHEGNPIEDGGEHRHATRAQRRALKARWGSLCAVNGCSRAGVIPHHVLWFSKGGLTVLDNLVPVCLHHHHDVHEGHRSLRLRDSRVITPEGWAEQLARAA